MRRLEHRSRVSKTIPIAVFAGGLLLASPAGAADSHRSYPQDQKPVSSLSTGASTEGASTFAVSTGLDLSPSGCRGYTDYPHKSGSDAAVHGRTTCLVPVSYVQVSTDLARDRWYGMEFLANGKSSRNNNRKSYDATPHWNCSGVGTYTYRGYSSHLTLENGKNYYANTANWQVPGESRFAC